MCVVGEISWRCYGHLKLNSTDSQYGRYRPRSPAALRIDSWPDSTSSHSNLAWIVIQLSRSILQEHLWRGTRFRAFTKGSRPHPKVRRQLGVQLELRTYMRSHFVCLLLVYPYSCRPGPLSCHAWHLTGPAPFAHVYCLPLWCQIPTWKWNWRPPTLFQYGILGTKSTNYGAKGFQPHARGRSIPSTPLPRWLSTAADTLVSL